VALASTVLKLFNSKEKTWVARTIQGQGAYYILQSILEEGFSLGLVFLMEV
jgi:hypothetical protein